VLSGQISTATSDIASEIESNGFLIMACGAAWLLLCCGHLLIRVVMNFASGAPTPNVELFKKYAPRYLLVCGAWWTLAVYPVSDLSAKSLLCEDIEIYQVKDWTHKLSSRFKSNRNELCDTDSHSAVQQRAWACIVIFTVLFPLATLVQHASHTWRMQTNRFSTGRTSWVYQFYKPNCALYSFGLLATRSISLPWLGAYANDEPQTKFIVCLSLAIVYCIGAAVLRPYKNSRWLAADIATAIISVGLVGIAAVASPEKNTIAAPPTPGQEFGMWTVVVVVIGFVLFCLVTWSKGLSDQLPKLTDFHPTFTKPSMPGKASGLSKASSLPADTHKVDEPPEAAEEPGQEFDSPHLILDPDEELATSEGFGRLPADVSMVAPSDASSELRQQPLAAALAQRGAGMEDGAGAPSDIFGSRSARRGLERALQSWSTGQPETSTVATQQPLSEFSQLQKPTVPAPGLGSTVKRTIGNIGKPPWAGHSGSSSGSGDGGDSLPMDADLNLYPEAADMAHDSSVEDEAQGPWSSKMLKAFSKSPDQPDAATLPPTSTSPIHERNFIDADIGMDVFRGYVRSGTGPLAVTAAVQEEIDVDDVSEADEAEVDQQFKWV